jgi:hypothetical protein
MKIIGNIIRRVIANLQKALIHSKYVRKVTKTLLFRFGECEFFGDKEFINVVKKSLCFLKEIDIATYLEIRAFKSIFIQTNNEYYVNTRDDTYSVFNRSVKWGVYGVLICIYNAYCCKNMSAEKSLAAQIEWMQKLNFPKGLIDPKIERQKRDYK